MIKKTLCLVVAITFFSCKIIDSNKDKIRKNGFLSYSLSTGSNELDINASFTEMYKDAESREDSLLIKSLIQKSNELAVKLKNNSEKLNYYIIGDTVKIEDSREKTIYIPSTFKKFTERKFRDKIYKHELDWGKLYKRWNTNYQITTNKEDKKKVLGITGYKLIITETSVRTFDTYIEIYELYINDEYNIPFTYYDFLKLKKQINLEGLILECKTYYKETPNLNNIYEINDFNFKKQPKSLIKFNKNEYTKQNL